MDTEAQSFNSARYVRDATVDARMSFVRKVYSILLAQLLMTVAIAVPFQVVETAWLKDHVWLVHLSMAVTITTICIMSCNHQFARRFPVNYLLLFVLTVFIGILVGFISAAFTWQSALLAACVTVFVFVTLTIYALNTTNDFTGNGPYLFAMLAVLLIFAVEVSLLTMCGVQIRWLTVIYDVLGVLVFVLAVVFDTQLMLGAAGGHKYQFAVDDYVFAALNLYCDLVNVFVHLVSMMGDSMASFGRRGT